jgi:hypothetical protein
MILPRLEVAQIAHTPCLVVFVFREPFDKMFAVFFTYFLRSTI